MGTIMTYIGYFFVAIGAAFLFLGSLGILRMPDIYNRLQAGTKASTLGSLGMLLGIGFLQPEWMVKVIIIMLFILLTNPISSHAIARGSYKAGVKPYVKLEDKYSEEQQKNEEK
jgi:multicomponent Na+:H+ antiporter subunit G